MAWEGRPAGPITHPTPMPRGLGVEVPEPRAVPGLLLLFFFFGCAQSLLREAGFFSSCSQGSHSPVATGSRAQAQWLWHTDIVASRHVASSWIRN